MKTHDFVFAEAHGANRPRKSSPLANRDSENFYFAFAALLLRFLRPARNLPLRPSNLSLPSRPYFSLLFLIFFFSASIINKTIKESKTSKTNNALTKILK
jgi:hypothetical protein